MEYKNQVKPIELHGVKNNCVFFNGINLRSKLEKYVENMHMHMSVDFNARFSSFFVFLTLIGVL